MKPKWIKSEWDELIRDEMKLKEIKANNKNKMKADANKDRQGKILKAVISMQKVVWDVKTKSEKTYSNYRDSNIEKLEDYVGEKLRIVFPYDNYKVEIDFEYKRDDSVADFKIKKDGRNIQAKMGSGRFLRQLTSLITLVSLNRMKGNNVLEMDEPLSSADGQGLIDFMPVLQEMLDDGFQIGLVDHKEESYYEFPRRQFNLYYDFILEKTKIWSVLDYDKKD